MMDQSKGLKELARVAKNSSVRAYAGHSAEFRHIFDIKALNLTEYARSFGIYKVVHESMPKYKPQESSKDSKKPSTQQEATETTTSETFTKRL